MESIFNALYTALYGNVWLAILASFMWGMASVLLSPCHLSSIPLVISVLIGKRVITLKQTIILSTIFSVGILISIALIGFITALLGRMLGDLGSHANLIFGIALCGGGLLLMDIIPFGNISFLHKFRLDGGNQLTVLVIGLMFGLALGPCAFAFMAPVLTLVFSLVNSQLLVAIAIMAAYAVGHCAIIVVAGSSLGLVQKFLNWNQDSGALLRFKRVCALLVIVAGIYLIFK